MVMVYEIRGQSEGEVNKIVDSKIGRKTDIEIRRSQDKVGQKSGGWFQSQGGGRWEIGMKL